MSQCEATGQTLGRENFGKPCRRRAVTGATTCVVHGGLAKVPDRADLRGSQCVRIKTGGEQCKNFATPGTTVCRYHGSGAPNTRARAKERLQALVEPALVELNRILRKSDTTDADRLRAITLVMDRTGYGTRSELGVEVTVKPWEQTMQGIIKTPPPELLAGVDLPEIVVEAASDAEEPADPDWAEFERRLTDPPRVIGSANPPRRPRPDH